MAREYTVILCTRFRPDEAERLRALAAEVRLSPARYLREAALGARFQPRADAVLLAQLARIGNNLNQLARVANSTRAVPALRVLSLALDELRALLARVAP